MKIELVEKTTGFTTVGELEIGQAGINRHRDLLLIRKEDNNVLRIGLEDYNISIHPLVRYADFIVTVVPKGTTLIITL